MEISVDQLEELYPDFSEDQIQELYDRMHGDIPDQTPLSYPETQGVQPSLPDVPSDGITGGTEEVDAMDLVNPQPSKASNPSIPKNANVAAPVQMPQHSEPPTATSLPSSDQTPDDKQKQIDAYIAKYGLDKYFPDRRASLVSKVQEANSPPNIVAGLGALGAGLAGFNPIREGLHILDHQKASNESSVTAFDQGRKSSLENMELQKSVGNDIGENDLNSPQSRIGQNFLIKAGMKPELAKTVTAAQFKNFSPAYLKMYEQQQANARTQTMAGAKGNASNNVGQQTEDRLFAKDYNTYTSTGRNNALAGIAKLKELQKEVETDSKEPNQPLESSGGPLHSVQIIGDAFKNERFVRHRDTARNQANKVLKSMFGGTGITDSERQSASKEFWNDRLTDADNAKLLQEKINELESNFNSEDEKARYFGKNKTLKGFNGNAVAPLSPGEVEEGYRFKGGDPGDPNNWEPMQ